MKKPLIIFFVLIGYATHAQTPDNIIVCPVPNIQEATFVGGDTAMKAFLKDNIKYPQLAKDCECGATIFIRFTVDTMGIIHNVYPDTIMQKRMTPRCYGFVFYDADGKYVMDEEARKTATQVPCRQAITDMQNEAVRVIQLMPPWNPGTENGKPKAMALMLPVNFILK